MAKHKPFQRRRPRQARAQVTYDSIVEAAVQLLERSGPDALNTNAVAERAGVSIGTLYQYFPDKESVLLAAARREMAKPGLATVLMEALVRALESLLGTAAQSVQRRRRRTTVAVRSQKIVDKMEALLQLAMPVLHPIPIRRPRR